MDSVILPMAIFALIVFVPILLLQNKDKKRRERMSDFCDACRSVKPGMSKNEVINLLGGQYSNSYFEEDVEMIEYKYNGAFGPRIVIKLRHGAVIESHGENLNVR